MPTVERIPSPGPSADLIERLVAYVSPVVPDWPGSLEAATPAEIARYCELAGLRDGPAALPSSYVTWLASAGRSDGGLFDQALRAWVSIAELITFYEECHRFEPEFIEPQLPVILNFKIGDEASVDLRGDDPDPPVLETASGEVMGPLSRSWEALLFQTAVQWCEPQRFAAVAIYGASARSTREALDEGPEDRVDLAAARAMSELDLEPAWFSDARHVFGFSDNLSALVDVGLGGEAPLKVVGEDSRRVQEIGARLAAKIGAAPAAHERWR